MAFNNKPRNNVEVATSNLNEVKRIIELKKSQLLLAFQNDQLNLNRFESNLFRLCDNNNLKDCSALSIVGAAVQAAYLGLSLDPILGQAYVVPRWNNKLKRTEASFLTGYQGFIELIRRSGRLLSYNTVLVYEKEQLNLEYTLFGINFLHKPLSPSKRGDKIIGGYMLAFLKDGGNHLEFMWNEEIEAIELLSDSAKSNFSPWRANSLSREAMMKKTIIRRAFKSLPKSNEIAKVVALEEATEAGKTINYERVIDGEEAIIAQDQ